LKPGLESQEGNRSPGFYLRIYDNFLEQFTIVNASNRTSILVIPWEIA
jgi:hypothetical protein